MNPVERDKKLLVLLVRLIMIMIGRSICLGSVCFEETRVAGRYHTLPRVKQVDTLEDLTAYTCMRMPRTLAWWLQHGGVGEANNQQTLTSQSFNACGTLRIPRVSVETC
jgi:hypothetical protein